MADSKARGNLSVNPPNQISKDVLVSDSSIPLSPQWLLPKLGESKAGMASGEHHPSPYSGFNTQSDVMKLPLNREEIQGVQEKKDVFRPSVLSMESGRRDRWRDEERDAHSSIGRDRWREEDKQLDNCRKIDRWTAPGKHFEEARRPPSERWSDLSRDIGYEQRRESKWSTRWGPDNKDTSKWNDSGKPSDISYVKGSSHLGNHRKDEREDDQYRSWRSNFNQGRGKAELHHNIMPVGSKEGHTFGHGRGRSFDTAHSTFMQGRGRFGYRADNVNHILTDSQALGFVSENANNNDHMKSAPFKYGRKNLLDIFRVIDAQLVHMLWDGFEIVPSLTLGEPLEPLALSPPTSEELVIISGIEKGDIVSSGAPQISNEGSAGRAETMQQRRITSGIREGVSVPAVESNPTAEWLNGSNSNFPVGSPQEKQMLNCWSSSKLDPVDTNGKSADDTRHGEGSRGSDESVANFDCLLGNRDSNLDGKALSHAGAAWYSSLSERTNALSHNQFDASANTHAQSTDVGWQQLHKNHPIERKYGSSNSSIPQSDSRRTTGEDPIIWQQVSGTVVQEQESRKHLLISPSPEDLILYYKDPQGAVQGPFSGSDIIGWFEAGYFDIDLPVRLANEPLDSPFSMLGDIMPHLKTKRTPPGFIVPKANEILDISSMPTTSNLGKILTSPSGVDLIREGHPHPHGASTEAANRFFESLMANKSNPPDRFHLSEGHNTSGVQPVGMVSGDTFDLLIQRLAFERQIPLPNTYPQWPARGTSPGLLNSQFPPDSSVSHPKALPVSIDTSPQSYHPQNVDIMSILRGSSDRPLVNINEGASGWSNFSAQGGLDQFKEPHGQNFLHHAAFDLQQQRMTAQNHPFVANLSGQEMDNSSNVLTADKLLSSALPQDPQVINLLQQQYMLQMRSQAPSPAQQLSVLDKILLLKQQQQEEQLRQQQQLLSQVLTDQSWRYGDASYGQLHAMAASTVSTGHAAANQLWHNLPSQMLEGGPKIPPSTVQAQGVPYSTGMPLYAAHDVGFTAVSETAMHTENHVGHNQQMRCTETGSKDGDANLNDASMESRTTLSLPVSMDAEKAKDDSGLSSSAVQVPLLNLRSEELVSAGTSLGSISNSVLRDNMVVSLEKSSGKMNEEISLPEQSAEATGLRATLLDKPTVNEEKNSNLVASKEEPKLVEAREMKKSSEKKSRKQKSSKVQPSSSNLSKGTAKSSSKASKQSESGEMNNSEVIRTIDEINVDTEKVEQLPSSLTNGEFFVDVKVDPEVVVSAGNLDAPESLAQKVWKAAANVKAKSLLEIQLEEQRRAKAEVVSAVTSSVHTISLSAPWAGVVSSLDPKLSSVAVEGCNNGDINFGKLVGSVINNSPGHDFKAAEVLSSTNLKELAAFDTLSGINGLPALSSQLEALDDDDFIDAKETKKSRKKGGKGKGAGNKATSTISMNDPVSSNSSIEKGKNSRQVQPEKEVFPAPSQNPSLGDFVPWKPDLSSSATPAWSKDSAVPSKPTSLRDILKEQEKKGGSSQQHSTPLPTPHKSQVAQVNRVSSWSVSDTSPAKAPSRAPTRKGEDDLFWGPPDLSRQESKLANVPQVGNHGNWGTKGNPAKVSSSGVASTRQKSAGGSMGISSSATAAKSSSLKGKQNFGTKQSEAMDFRDWCERESIRLTGSKDTSFLEFCLKQPRSEAEILLVQNLGSLDMNHEFIGKFLDYMEMLPAEVLDIAFQNPKDRDITSMHSGGQVMNSPSTGNSGAGAEGAVGKGGKKGKKGKKVSPSVLGFSVVSNRIMMGEIQTVDD